MSSDRLAGRKPRNRTDSVESGTSGESNMSAYSTGSAPVSRKPPRRQAKGSDEKELESIASKQAEKIDDAMSALKVLFAGVLPVEPGQIAAAGGWSPAKKKRHLRRSVSVKLADGTEVEAEEEDFDNLLDGDNHGPRIAAKRMLAYKEKYTGAAGGDNGDAVGMEPVVLGDLVSLENMESISGMLTGDRAFNRCGVQAHSWLAPREGVGGGATGDEDAGGGASVAAAAGGGSAGAGAEGGVDNATDNGGNGKKTSFSLLKKTNKNLALLNTSLTTLASFAVPNTPAGHASKPKPPSLEFDKFAFRIVPKLKFNKRDELEEYLEFKRLKLLQTKTDKELLLIEKRAQRRADKVALAKQAKAKAAVQAKNWTKSPPSGVAALTSSMRGRAASGTSFLPGRDDDEGKDDDNTKLIAAKAASSPPPARSTKLITQLASLDALLQTKLPLAQPKAAPKAVPKRKLSLDDKNAMTALLPIGEDLQPLPAAATPENEGNEVESQEKNGDEAAVAQAGGDDDDDDFDDEDDYDEDEEDEGDLGTIDAEEFALRQKVYAEEAQNAHFLTSLASGDHGYESESEAHLRYGMEVHLQHVTSGLFVTLLVKEAAPLDPHCRRVVLAPARSSSVFRAMPRFKAQTVGGSVYFTHFLKFECGAMPGNFLHTSFDSRSAATPYHPLPNPTDVTLPKTLRTGLTYESNVAARGATFKISKRHRRASELKDALFTGVPFRLYHNQSDCFVQASGNPEKGRQVGSFTEAEMRVGDSGGGGGSKSLRMHLPYLKSLNVADESNGPPQPNDPNNLNATQLFVVEPLSRKVVNTVSWDVPCRLRHVTSGKYLAVNTDAPPQSGSDSATAAAVGSGGGGEAWFVPFLADDCFPAGHDFSDFSVDDLLTDGDASGALDLVFPQHLLFYLTPTEETAQPWLPNKQDVALRIEHRYKVSTSSSKNNNGGTDSSSSRERVLFLHDAEVPKPWSSTRFQAGQAEVEALGLLQQGGDKGGDKGGGGGGGGEAAAAVAGSASHKAAVKVAFHKGARKGKKGHSTLLVFSDTRSAEDVLTLMHASREESDVVDSMKSFVNPVQSFAYMVRDPLLAVQGEDGMAVKMVGLYLDLFRLLVHGKSVFPRVDWVKKANGTLPAAFSSLFGGEPNAAAQSAAREVRLLDAIFHASVSPYIRTFPSLPFDESSEAEALLGVKAVQKFTHVALQKLNLKNKRNQSYFGKAVGPGLGALVPLSSSAVAAAVSAAGKGAAVPIMVPPPPAKWMDSVTSQLEDPLGAAVTLSALLSASMELMRDYANLSFVQKFMSMVRHLGPQPRLLHFFQSLCVVDGKGVIANQELVLREIWLYPHKRRGLFLEVLTLKDLADEEDGKDLATTRSAEAKEETDAPKVRRDATVMAASRHLVARFPPVVNATTGQEESSRFSVKEMLTWPSEFIGQEYVGLVKASSNRTAGSGGGGANGGAVGEGVKGGGGPGSAMKRMGKRATTLATGRAAGKGDEGSAAVVATVADLKSSQQQQLAANKWPGVDFSSADNDWFGGAHASSGGVVGSFRPVFVKWAGSHEWQGTDSLFYPPSIPEAPSAGALRAAMSASPKPSRPRKKGLVGRSRSQEADDEARSASTGKGRPPSNAAASAAVAAAAYKETMGFPPIPSFACEGSNLVRIEALCWVLAPERLCESVAGMEWARVCWEREKDPVKETCFQRQLQLAHFFVAELNLLCDMCFGRSDNCCSAMRESFSYEMLVSLGYNPHLPPGVRAACIKMCRLLYLDSYPQAPNCGRPSMPEQLWVYKVVDPSHRDAATLPAIKHHVSLDDDGALPTFTLPVSHPLFGDLNPHLGFRRHTKFFFLRHLGNSYLNGLGDGCLSYEATAVNELTLSVVQHVINALLSFGFQSTILKVEALMQGAVKLLDGRNDVLSSSVVASSGSGSTGGGRRASGVKAMRPSSTASFFKRTNFERPSDRFEVSSVSPSCTRVKTAVIAVMMEVANLRANFRLSKLMGSFKALVKDQSRNLELRKLHCCLKANKLQAYNGSLLKELSSEFEELFVSGDGARMDMEALTSGMPVNTILLDCLMYEDDYLFEAALKCLERSLRQRAKLLEAVSEATLLETEVLPVVGHTATMLAELNYFRGVLEQSEQWACESDVSGPFDLSKYSFVLGVCSKIQAFLVVPEHGPKEEWRDAEGGGKQRDVELMPPPPPPDFSGGESPPSLNSSPGKPRQKKSFSFLTKASSPAPTTKSNAQTSPAAATTSTDTGVSSIPPAAALFVSEPYKEQSLIPPGKEPQRCRQDVLRSMNAHGAVLDNLNGLRDYNVSYADDKLPNLAKLTSRRILVSVLKALMDVLTQFVKAHPSNQRAVWKTSLSSLLEHTGKLVVPRTLGVLTPTQQELQSELGKAQNWPIGIGAEAVLIECLRGNFALVSEGVPLNVVERFGQLLEEEEDVSASPLLDFFGILCQPESCDVSLVRHQSLALEVLLKADTPKFAHTVYTVFFQNDGMHGNGADDDDEIDGDDFDDVLSVMSGRGGGGGGANNIDLLPLPVPPFDFDPQPCSKPERVVALLCQCIDHSNQTTATVLLTELKVSIETVLFAVSKRQTSLGTSFEFHEDPLLCSLLKLLGSMARVLTLDPRLLQKRQFWAVPAFAGRTILDAFTRHLWEQEGTVLAARAKKDRAGTKLLAAGGMATRKTLTMLHLPNLKAVPLKLHKTHAERDEERNAKEFGQLVLAVLKVTCGIINGAREQGMLSLEGPWKDQLVGVAASKPSSFSSARGGGRGAGGGGRGLERGGESRRPSTATSAASLAASAAAIYGHGNVAKGGVGFGVIGGKGGSEISSMCEELLKLIDPGNDALKKTPPPPSPLLQLTSTLSTSFAAAATLDGVDSTTAGAGGGNDGGGTSSGAEGSSAPSAPPKLANASSKEGMREESLDLSEAYEPRTKRDLFRFFVASLVHNPSIKNMVAKRRFTFAQVLEEAELATSPPPPSKSQSSSSTTAAPAAAAPVTTAFPPLGATAASVAAAAASSRPQLGTSASALKLDDYKKRFPAAVVVTWTSVVVRMVCYLKAHNYDKDEEHGVRIFNALTAHLLRARSNEDGTLVDLTGELEGHERAARLGEFNGKQEHLDKHGALVAAMTSIATHSPDVPGNVADVACEFLSECVRYGNATTQASVWLYISGADKEAKVLSYLRVKLLSAMRSVRERQAANGGKGFEAMDDELRSEYGSGERVMAFMALLMEGHNLALQDLLREQPNRDASIDLIQVVNQLFVLQSSSEPTLVRMEDTEVELLTRTMSLLVESMQGPCPRNQNHITKYPGFFNSVDKVMGSSFHPRVDKAVRLAAKQAAVDLLAASLEARTDKVVHQLIAEEMMPLSLDLFRQQLCGVIENAAEAAAAQALVPAELLALSSPGGSLDSTAEQWEELEDTCIFALVSLTAVYEKMRAVPRFYQELRTLTRRREALRGGAKDAMDLHVCQVEVSWNRSVEVLSFRNPLETKYLSEATKSAFEQSVDIRTAGRRMEGLVAETPTFCLEIRRIDTLCREFKFYRFLYPRIRGFKWLLYSLVLLLNLNLMMVTFGSEGSEETHDPANGFNKLGPTLVDLALDDGSNNQGWMGKGGSGGLHSSGGSGTKNTYSVLVSFALAVAILVGYAVVLWFVSMSEVPMLIKHTDARAAALMEAAEAGTATAPTTAAGAEGAAAAGDDGDSDDDDVDDDGGNPSKKQKATQNKKQSSFDKGFRDPQALVRFGLAAASVFAFAFMHATNYNPNLFANSRRRERQNLRLYFSFLLPALAVFALQCLRQWVVVPDTKSTRAWCIGYDLLCTKPFFRNNVLWLVVTFLGFSSNEWFSLLLLDIMALSTVLGYVAQCILLPGKSLLWVTYLVMASALVYTQFGLAHFEDEWDDTCHGALSCFWHIAYKATSNSKMLGFDSTTNELGVGGGNKYMLKMLFDLVWFAWMFILFKIIGGFIFSTFVGLNNSGYERSNVLRNSAFVSGLDRAKYGDLGLKEPSFDELVKGTQNHWNYVKLMLYLIKRNSVDLNGCESYVKECLEKESLEWVPAKTSFAIQKSGKKYDPPLAGGSSGGGAGGGKKDVQKTLMAYHRECLSLRNEVAEVSASLARLEATAGGPTGVSRVAKSEVNNTGALAQDNTAGRAIQEDEEDVEADDGGGGDGE